AEAPAATEPATEEPEAAAPAGPTEPAPVEKPVLTEQEEPAAPASGETQGLFDWYAHKPAAWVLTGVGVVGLGVGITVALVANHDYANANTLENQILAQWNMGDVDRVGGKPCEIDPKFVTNKTIRQDTFDAYKSGCAEYTKYKNDGDTARTVAIVSTAVGGAAIIGTVVYYFVDRRSPKPQTGGGRFRAHGVPWTPPAGGRPGPVGSFSARARPPA